MLSRLYTLLLVSLIAWSSWAMFGGEGIFVCAMILGFALAIALRSWPAFWVVLLILLLLGSLLMPAVQSSHECSRRGQCLNNLRQISLAVLAYESDHKCYPPPYIADKNGKPMHSWRVLMLPYLERYDLYEEYDFNEPWDGPNNRKLLAKRPRLFACPNDATSSKGDGTTTSYVAVVGKNALWRAESPRTANEVAASKGGASGTVMLIEAANSGINWTEPRDFDLDASTSEDSAHPLARFSFVHFASSGSFFSRTNPTGVACVSFADGHHGFLRATNAPDAVERLKDLFSVGGYSDDQESECLPSCELSGSERINWPNCIALAVWLVSVILLFHQAIRSKKALPQRAEESTD